MWSLFDWKPKKGSTFQLFHMKHKRFPLSIKTIAVSLVAWKPNIRIFWVYYLHGHRNRRPTTKIPIEKMLPNLNKKRVPKKGTPQAPFFFLIWRFQLPGKQSLLLISINLKPLKPAIQLPKKNGTLCFPGNCVELNLLKAARCWGDLFSLQLEILVSVRSTHQIRLASNQIWFEAPTPPFQCTSHGFSCFFCING